VGVSPVLIVNAAEQARNPVSGLLIAPLAIVLCGTLGFIAGALVASGISIGRALGPGRRIAAPTVGGIVGGAIGFALALVPYGVVGRQPFLSAAIVAALAGSLTAAGITLAGGLSKAPLAKLAGGALGGVIGFGLVAVMRTLATQHPRLVLAAGPIIGLAIAYGIARREAPAAMPEAGRAAGGRP
jgi:hypothetical protein